jgi:hypothetical protein
MGQVTIAAAGNCSASNWYVQAGFGQGKKFGMLFSM